MKQIGIDIGRVIISGDTDIPDQFFGPNYLNTPRVKGAFGAIAHLVKQFGASQVFLVSKCGEQTQQRTWSWLKHQHFFEATGINQTNIHFCRERHQKADICNTFGIDIFIDDRFSVLKHLAGLAQLYLFAPSKDELAAFHQSQLNLPITIVETWEELLADLL